MDITNFAYYLLHLRIRNWLPTLTVSTVTNRLGISLFSSQDIKILIIEDSIHIFHFQVNFCTPYLIQLKEFFSNQMSNLSCSTLKIIVRSSVTQTCGRPDNITTLWGADNFEASSLFFPLFYLLSKVIH